MHHFKFADVREQVSRQEKKGESVKIGEQVSDTINLY